MNRAMKILIVLVMLLGACGSDPKPVASSVPVPQLVNDRAQQMPAITLEELLAPPIEQVCSSSSDCAGNGKCSGGKCGSCSSSSDCNGNGKCSGGVCGSCSSSSDCSIGKCNNSKCGGCSSSSDCKGGKCESGKCSNYTN